MASMELGNHRRSVLEDFSRLAVNVNGLVIPGRSIESALARHARNLVVINDDETFKVSLPGSATAIRYAGREILLTTRHQLQGVDESRVGLLVDSQGTIITSGGFRSYQPSTETDAYDIVAFDFAEPCAAKPELKRHFFNFSNFPPVVSNDQILAMLLCGYPSSEQVYDILDNNHIGVFRRQLVCLPHSQPGDQSTLTVKAEKPLSQSPDGMSGGSAFVIQLTNGEPHGYFAGIILRGGREFFHILKARFIVEFLNNAFSSASRTHNA